MSTRSLYPSGVVVGTADLQRTERERSLQTKRAVVDLGSNPRLGFPSVFGGGRVDGLVIGVSGNVVTVSSGVAYAPNGERIVVDVDQAGISLSDYSDGVVNLIAVTYLEVPTTPNAHETDGTAPNTEASASFSVTAMTAAEYLAFPTSADTDLTVPAQDRILVVGSVLGNGITTGTPNNLVASEISQFTLEPVQSITYATDTLEGVRLVSANTTSQGSGTLRLDLVDIDAGAYNLYFTAPGDTEGAAVDVFGLVEDVTLTSAGGDTLVVDVDWQLMVGNAVGSTSRTVTFASLYNPPSYGYGWPISASDQLLRALLGGAAPTTANPHGAAGLDAIVADIARLRLGNAQASSAERDNAFRLILEAGGNGTRQAIAQVRDNRALSGANQGHIRTYFLAGAGQFELTRNAWWDNTSAMWYKDDTSDTAYRVVFADSNSVLARLQSFAGAGPWADASWDDSLDLTGSVLTMVGDVAALNDVTAGAGVAATDYVEVANDSDTTVAGTAGRVYADTMIHAWGRVTMSGNGAGGITSSTLVGCSLTEDPITNAYLSVTFSPAFQAATDYVVTCSVDGVTDITAASVAQNSGSAALILLHDVTGSPTGIDLSTTAEQYVIRWMAVGKR